MEDELRCPACRHLYVRPVQLPGCWHSLCRGCALARVQLGPSSAAAAVSPSSSSLTSLLVDRRRASSVRGGDDAASVVTATTDSGSEPDCSSSASSDALSVVSESDSGVVTTAAAAASSSRPPSSLDPAAAAAAAAAAETVVIACPACSRVVAVDGGVAALPPTRALDAIVSRYRDARGGGAPAAVDCDSAAGTCRSPATRMCVDCELYLCDACQHSDQPTHLLTDLVDAQRQLQVLLCSVHGPGT